MVKVTSSARKKSLIGLLGYDTYAFSFASRLRQLRRISCGHKVTSNLITSLCVARRRKRRGIGGPLAAEERPAKRFPTML